MPDGVLTVTVGPAAVIWLRDPTTLVADCPAWLRLAALSAFCADFAGATGLALRDRPRDPMLCRCTSRGLALGADFVDDWLAVRVLMP